MIDISKMSKAKVLAALYNASQQLGMGFTHARGREPMTEADAEKELANHGPYFDYLHGRVMKIDLSGPQLDPRLYDRDNGDGCAAAVLAGLK